MYLRIHKNARVSFALRKEIQESNDSINSLALKYGLSWKTVKKWKERESIEDKSSRPHRLRISLTKEEEDLILFERKKFKKTVEEIYFSLNDKVPNLYSLKIYRCLVRYGLNVLPCELIKAERKIKKFRRYTIGYLHLDTLYSPKINKRRFYLFTAIDRVSKLAFIRVQKTKTKEMGVYFLKQVLNFYPYKIHYILTDNGGEFSYNHLHQTKRPKDKRVHPFDKLCQENKIKHRTIKFKHPWTNGMVERFNGKIKDKVFKRYIFDNEDDLKEKLYTYLNDYNFKVKLRQLNYLTPADYLKTRFGYSIQRIVI
jgi:Integrase core domain.